MKEDLEKKLRQVARQFKDGPIAIALQEIDELRVDLAYFKEEYRKLKLKDNELITAYENLKAEHAHCGKKKIKNTL